jgi:hypothetical protein
MTRFNRLIQKCSSSPAFWLAMLIALLVVASNHPALRSMPGAAANAQDRPTLKSMNNDKSLLREGTAIAESKGRFKLVDDRILFSDESLGKSFKCLENLMLQRIKGSLNDDEGFRQRWSISGKISEFNGENFLWLDRAIRAQ